MPVSFTFSLLPPPFLSPLTFLFICLWHSLFQPTPPWGRWKERGILLSQYFSFTWTLRSDVWEMRSSLRPHESGRPLLTASLLLRFRGLRFGGWERSGSTSLFSLTRCSADITATASLEQEKYSGWIPRQSMATISFKIAAAAGWRRTQKWKQRMRNYRQQHKLSCKKNRF